MTRLIILCALITFSVSFTACHSQCKKVQKNNGKFIAGTHDFGKKKDTKKFKRKNRHGF